MVAIMWLTGGKKLPVPAKSASSVAPVQAPLEVNESKIAEMQNRIQDLQRQQLVAQTALAQQTRQLGAAAHDSPQSQQLGAGGAGEQRSQEDRIQAERKRRAYVSLFSSNVALSYRKPLANAPAAATETTLAVPAPLPSNPDTSQIAQLLKDMQPNSVSPVPPRNDSAEAIKDRKEETKNPAAVSAGSANAAAGKTYLLFEGTILETVLINRLDGGFAGPVECLLSTDVYSNDRQHLLIPAGSKLLGETKKVDTFGQTRLAVLFHRVLMPDGYSVSLDQFKGLNQVGDTGLRDQVNNHYLRICAVWCRNRVRSDELLKRAPPVLPAPAASPSTQGKLRPARSAVQLRRPDGQEHSEYARAVSRPVLAVAQHVLLQHLRQYRNMGQRRQFRPDRLRFHRLPAGYNSASPVRPDPPLRNGRG